MARALGDLLSGLPERRRRGFQELSDERQRDVIQYIEATGSIPPLRRLSILFGPERLVQPDRNRWMAM